MKKHTPGPWRALKGTGRYSDTHQIWAGKHWIANTKCESCPVHEEANARLITAAPDMFDLLKLLGPWPIGAKQIVDIFDQAEKIIKEIEGAS